MPSRQSRRLLAGITALILTAACGCAAPAGAALSAPAGTVITVAAVPATGAAGLYIAADDGLFARAGITVRISSSVSAADTVSSLLTGKIQVSIGQWTSALQAQARGARLRAIAAGNAGGPGLEELITLPGSPVTGLARLRGQAIAVNATGGLSQMLTEQQLINYGITSSQVRWAVYPFPAMARALAEHKVAAAFAVEPYLSEAEASLGATELADLDSGPAQEFPITGYVASSAWARAHPALLAAFTRALEEGQVIAATDRVQVEHALERHLGISPMIASVMSLGDFPVGPPVPAQLARVADLMRASGLLPPATDTAALARALVSG
jgi:NitT/TauT family transport system substrate-binding protein